MKKVTIANNQNSADLNVKKLDKVVLKTIKGGEREKIANGKLPPE